VTAFRKEILFATVVGLTKNLQRSRAWCRGKTQTLRWLHICMKVKSG